MRRDIYIYTERARKKGGEERTKEREGEIVIYIEKVGRREGEQYLSQKSHH